MIRFITYALTVSILLTGVCVSVGSCQTHNGNPVEEVKIGHGKVKSKTILHKDRLIVNRGEPKDMSSEGIYLWLDDKGVWQVRWLGEPGQRVWFRFDGENVVNVLNTIGDSTKYFVSNDMTLTVMGANDVVEKLGISFLCESESLIIDAKLGVDRDASKVRVGPSSKKVSSGLPVGLSAPFFKNKTIVKSNKMLELGFSVNNGKVGMPEISDYK